MAMALSSPPGPTVRLSSSTFSLPYQVRLHQLQHPIRSTSALPIVSNFRSLLRSSAVSTSRLKISCAMPSTSDPKSGVAVCKPKLFEALVSDAANALAYAIEDGKTKVEIDFPPLPSNISSYKGSSDEFIDANIQLVLAVVRKLQEKRQLRVSIVFPDKPEKRRAAQILATALDSVDGISIGSPDDAPGTAVSSFFRSIRNTLDLDFDDENEGRWESNQPADLYVFINCSGCELSLIEKYVEKFATSTSLLFNLELYTLWHVPTFNTTWVGRPFLSIPTNTVTAAPFRFTNPLLPESSMTLNPWKFHLPSTSSTKLPFSFTTKPRIPTHLCFFNSNTNTNKKSKHQYTTPIPASEIPARDRVLDFGKYKGRMLGTLPSTYLRWVSKNLRARDFEEWAIMADQVLQDPYYKDRLEWECAEKVLNGDILTSFSHSLPSSPSSPSFALEEISDRFGWDNEDKVAWSKVNFELLGTSKGGRIPRISQEEGRRRLKREEEVGGGSVKGEEMGKEERRAGVKGRRNERRDRVRLKKSGGGGMDVRSKRTYDGLEEDREERWEVRLLHRRDEDDGDVFNRFPGREGLLKKVLSSKQRRRGTI